LGLVLQRDPHKGPSRFSGRFVSASSPERRYFRPNHAALYELADRHLDFGGFQDDSLPPQVLSVGILRLTLQFLSGTYRASPRLR
jgi:hypothetical protein